MLHNSKVLCELGRVPKKKVTPKTKSQPRQLRNILEKPERLQLRITEHESGTNLLQTSHLKPFLTEDHYAQLLAELATQRELARTYKTQQQAAESANQQWRDSDSIRLQFAKDGLKALESGLLDAINKLKKERETKATRIYLDAYFAATETNKAKGANLDPVKAGNNALRRAGFNPTDANLAAGRDLNARAREMESMERAILGDDEWEKRFGDNQDWWKKEQNH